MQQYSYQYQQYNPLNKPKPDGDVPLSTVIIVGVVTWFLLFGTIFGYAALAPCDFVALVGGDIQRLGTATGLDLTKIGDCRAFLRIVILGRPS